MSADKTPILQLDNVSLHYKTRKGIFNHGVHTVLDDVSMSLGRGETLGIVGKNGCGKSTILRLMAGIFAPSSGKVTLMPDISIALLSIGLGFKPNLTGRDNAMLAAMLQGTSRREAEDCLEAIKEFSELGDSFEEPVKNYSSGMRSRLGFSTAIIAEVDILLIDEILSVGDAHFRQKAQKTLTERISGEQSVVFVSHAAPQVQRLCDRAVWLHEGRVRHAGVTAEVLEAYSEYVESIRPR